MFVTQITFCEIWQMSTNIGILLLLECYWHIIDDCILLDYIMLYGFLVYDGFIIGA